MPISTHILDTALGRAAADVPVSLAVLEAGQWKALCSATTDADGRCPHLLPPDRDLLPGLFRIRFDTAAYFQRQRMAGLYPYIEIVFEVVAEQIHYHIPLLLTANGYTTYRGS